MEDEDLSFQKVIRVNTQRYAMVLPRAFVVAAGLEYKTNIKMKDHEGYEWRVGIIVERTFRRIKHSLSSGWSKFRQHCNLADDDVCFFKYDKEEGILNLTHVIKSKRSTTNAVDAVRIEDECSPTDKPSDGAKVSVECESGRELDMAQRKMGRPLLNGGTDVKIKDEWDAEAIAMRKKRRLLEKNEQERERVVRSNQSKLYKSSLKFGQIACFVPNVTKVQGSSLWGNLWCKNRPHRENTCTKSFHKSFPQGRYLHQSFLHRDDPCTFVTFGTKHAIWPNFRGDLCNLLFIVIVIVRAKSCS
ncbi:DNA-binding pseudobarrel domain-containing protein [Artemisia annua]|uniref:DNA-binding pseudobarrel domain-containing protein n=1 Tax=Artemisia annua TaxID=35608 RepID=A0A2U1NBE2_ARTAN|nr:DNA-binding pseudobarrel domain-containing protein [Artemisia annua]